MKLLKPVLIAFGLFLSLVYAGTQIASAAIAFDAAAGSDTSGTSMFFPQFTTSTSSNTILWVAAWQSGVDGFNAQYASTTMTKVSTAPLSLTGGGRLWLWYLINPAPGVNNVAITASSSEVIRAHSAVYTGASQTGVPDSATSSQKAATQFSAATSTTVADGSWLVASFRENINATCGPVNGGATRSYEESACLFDSNGAKSPPGQWAINVTSTSSNTSIGLVSASFAPAPTAKTIGGTGLLKITTGLLKL